MEAPGDQDHFRYIPFRCYLEDGYRQKLIKPVTEEGQKKTLNHLLQEVFPNKTDGRCSLVSRTSALIHTNSFY